MSCIVPGCVCLPDVISLRRRNRPPEMGIVVEIGAICWDWEGDFVWGGWKRRVLLQSGGRKRASGGRACLKVVGAGVCGCLSYRGWLGKSTAGLRELLCWAVAGRRILPRAPKSVKMLSQFYGFNARAYPSA